MTGLEPPHERAPRARVATAWALVVASVAAAATAATSPGPLLARWTQKLDAADQALVRGDLAEAEKRSRGVLEDMYAKLEHDEGAALPLARASLFLALAAQARGDRRGAEWELAIVRALAPDLLTGDVDRFGAAAGALRELLAPTPGADAPGTAPARTGDYRPPKPVGVLQPRIPFRKYRDCGGGNLGLLLQVGADGLPRAPEILGEGPPVMVFTALAAARRWSFRPALLDGEPVASEYRTGMPTSAHNCG